MHGFDIWRPHPHIQQQPAVAQFLGTGGRKIGSFGNFRGVFKLGTQEPQARLPISQLDLHKFRSGSGYHLIVKHAKFSALWWKRSTNEETLPGRPCWRQAQKACLISPCTGFIEWRQQKPLPCVYIYIYIYLSIYLSIYLYISIYIYIYIYI